MQLQFSDWLSANQSAQKERFGLFWSSLIGLPRPLTAEKRGVRKFFKNIFKTKKIWLVFQPYVLYVNQF